MCCQITAQGERERERERERDHHGNKSVSYTLLQICGGAAGEGIMQEPRALENGLKHSAAYHTGFKCKTQGGCAVPKSHNQVRVVICKIAAEQCTEKV